MENIKKMFRENGIEFIEKKEERIEFSLNKVTYLIGSMRSNKNSEFYFMTIVSDMKISCVVWFNVLEITEVAINLSNGNPVMAINLLNIEYDE